MAVLHYIQGIYGRYDDYTNTRKNGSSVGAFSGILVGKALDLGSTTLQKCSQATYIRTLLTLCVILDLKT